MIVIAPRMLAENSPNAHAEPNAKTKLRNT